MTEIEIIDLARIVAGTIRTRMQPVAAEDDEQLAASIQAVGVLEPVLLRPARSLTTWPDALMPVNGPGNQMLEIVKGERRVEAARVAGLTRIPAVIRDMTDDEVLTEQAADSLHIAMHPVDQWLAMQAMIHSGMVPAKAGQVLGLKLPEIRKLERLGQLHPNMLALCRRDMPPEQHLRVIAMAPLELQEAAAERVLTATADDDDGHFDWWRIVDQCRQRVAYKAWAIFDTATAGIEWQEDLFAEPGSKQQFQTTDLDGFLAAQLAALEQKVAADKNAMLTQSDPRTGATHDPDGWTRQYGATERKRGQRTLYVLTWDGRVQEWIMARDKAPAAGEAAEEDGEPGDDGADDQDDAPPAVPAPPPEAITKAGIALIQVRKTAAVRAALAMDRDAHDLLILLILLFGAKNVHVQGIPYEQRKALDRLPSRLIGPDGNSHDDVSEETIRATARALIANVCDFTEGGTMNPGVGAPGEWIGRLLEADSHIGRFDDEAFLATCKADVLKEAAKAGQIKWAGTATAMRARLADQVEAWAPDAAQFGAPGPRA